MMKTCRRYGKVKRMRKFFRTVGGGLGLPSESSTLASVRLSICSSKKARSSRMRWMARRARWIREVRISLEFSISPIRFFISLHFWRYDCSTDAGRASPCCCWAPGDFSAFAMSTFTNYGEGFLGILRLCSLGIIDRSCEIKIKDHKKVENLVSATGSEPLT
jgi:hypothetical protein